MSPFKDVKKALLFVIAWALCVGTVGYLAGCATLKAGDPGPKLAIGYATLKYIGEDVPRAKRVVTAVDRAEALLDRNIAVAVPEIEKAVREQIDFSKLDPADRLLLNMLFDSVRVELEVRLGTGALNPEQLVKVRLVLGWVRDAAGFVQ